MNGVESIATCPLGSTCREIKDGKVYTCRWFIRMQGENPQSGEQVDDEYCSLEILPLLLVQQSREISQSAASLDSHRNEVVKRADVANQVLEMMAKKGNGQKRITNE